MDRLSVGLLLVAGAWAALAAMPGEDATVEPSDDPALSELDATSAELEGELAEIGVELTCDDIGGTDSDATGVDRYRGNVYRIEHTGTVLREIKMELSFVGDVQLHFTVRGAPSGEGAQTFTRPDGFNDIVVMGSGNGLPQLYSSGLFSLPLLKDFDYAIGVSWGRPTGSSVRYFNDSLTYPQPFTHGQTLERLLLNSPPPLSDEVVFSISTTSGAYSMELCFTPVAGACCDVAIGGCQSVTAAECTSAGSFFHGDRTDCREVPCSFGACCMPCGGDDCLGSYTPEACEAAGGDWAGRNVQCIAGLCPKITGACCTGSTCTEECVDDCAALGGRYLGDGTDCFPNMCAGACCLFGTGCADLTQSVCGAVGGSFRRLGTTCAALAPDDECGGPCCGVVLGETRCFQVDTRDECTEQPPDLTGAFYLGDAMRCSDFGADPCSAPTATGACCLPDGDCVFGSIESCESSDGLFLTNETTCTGISCSVPCCVPQDAGEPDACRMAPSMQACTDSGGTQALIQNGTCVPDPCSIQPGSCCFLNECTADSIRVDCESAGGRFFEESDCGGHCPTGQVGACCRPTGGCVDLVSMADCEGEGSVYQGVYKGDGSICEDVEAECDERGACCTETGDCLFLLEAECAGLGELDIDFTPGTECASVTCIAGACCITEPGLEPRCEIRRDDACPDDATHAYQGNDTVCGPNSCDVAACCLQDGTCEEMFGFQCESAGGEFNPGALCGANACESGACCVDGACSAQTLAACTSAGGAYQGVGEPCATDLCDLGSCCERDNTCTPDVVESQCNATNGLEFRPGLTCESALLCELIGGCCLRNGNCLNEVTRTSCETQGGQFTESTDPLFCDSFTCSARGACCRNGVCTDESEEDCTRSGGLYQGDLTICTAGLCTIGSCCLLDGVTCEDGLIRPQCGPERGSFRAGIACVDVACNRPGACCLRDGVCVNDVLETVCTLNDGSPTPDVLCIAAPLCVAEGACCLDDGECIEGTEADCVDAEGVYQGDDATCETSTCPTGACCVDGQCDELTEIGCAGAGGVYDGDGTTCAGGRCDVGGCCHLDGTCDDDVLRLECDGEFDQFEPFEECVAFCIGRGACCLPDEVCQDRMTQLQCQNAGGVFDGIGTVCDEELCTIAGCCLPDAPLSCELRTRQGCEVGGGRYLGVSSDCDFASGECARGACCKPDGFCTEDAIVVDCPAPGVFHEGLSCADQEVDCVAVGSCCFDDETCQVITSDECLGNGGRFSAGNFTCEPDDLCLVGACCTGAGTCLQLSRRACERRTDGSVYQGAGVDCAAVECAAGACCETSGSCADDLLASECTDSDSIFTPNEICANLECRARGACCNGTQCSVLARSDCLVAGGIYQGTGTACGTDVCALSIIGSDPADCSLDARQPYDPSGANPAGWNSIQLTFDGDTSGLDAGSFATSIMPPNGSEPMIMSVAPAGNTVTLELDSSIPPGHWTCITHVDSGDRVCVGALPADADGDATSNAADLVALLDCLMDGATCELIRCDQDRSGRCAAADVLRAIDMLGGAESYTPGWLGVSIGPCPDANP